MTQDGHMDEARENRLSLSAIDLDGLAEALQGGDSYLDPATGRIHGYRDEAGDDAIRVDCGGSGGNYSDSRALVADLTDPGLKEELAEALDGRRLFRDVGDVIEEAPERVKTAWATYRRTEAKLRALSWLARHQLVARSEIDAERASLE